MDSRPKTIICDIDGTLIPHWQGYTSFDKLGTDRREVLSGTRETLLKWEMKGYNLILMTGRKESMRKKTEEQLADLGIHYDQLVMGVGGGVRVLINDMKPSGELTAIAINLKRDEGLEQVDL